MFWKNKRIYMDYGAATPLSPAAYRAMKSLWFSNFGNSEAIHTEGREAKNVLEQYRKNFSGAINAQAEDKVVFTSGGTESNTMAVLGVLDQWFLNNPREHCTIITSSLEHASISKLVETCADREFVTVVCISVDQDGVTVIDDFVHKLEKAVNPVLVTIVFQSSEIGVNQPISEIAQKVKEYRQDHRENSLLFHSDVAQGMFVQKADVQKWGVDMASFCGQKFMGPKGSGALYVKKRVAIASLTGGNQEYGLRGGTPAVPLIVGFCVAFLEQQAVYQKNQMHVVQLKATFLDELTSNSVDFEVNGSSRSESVVLNLSFVSDSRDSERLIVAVDQVGIAVTSKSACLGSQEKPSVVLEAMGHDRANSIRFCFAPMLSKKEVREAARRISQVLNK